MCSRTDSKYHLGNITIESNVIELFSDVESDVLVKWVVVDVCELLSLNSFIGTENNKCSSSSLRFLIGEVDIVPISIELSTVANGLIGVSNVPVISGEIIDSSSKEGS